jgi:hypothetical protein
MISLESSSLKAERLTIGTRLERLTAYLAVQMAERLLLVNLTGYRLLVVTEDAREHRVWSSSALLWAPQRRVLT